MRQSATRVATPCAQWRRAYTVLQISLQYLLHLPDQMRAAYPMVSADRTAIAATAPDAVRWAMPADQIAANLDGACGSGSHWSGH